MNAKLVYPNVNKYVSTMSDDIPVNVTLDINSTVTDEHAQNVCSIKK